MDLQVLMNLHLCARQNLCNDIVESHELKEQFANVELDEFVEY